MKVLSKLAVAVVVGFVAMSTQARATSLLPGTTVTPNSVAGITGFTKLDSKTVTFDKTVGSDRLVGSLSTQVFKQNSTGNILFAYQTSIYNNTAGSVLKVYNNDFGKVTTDVSYFEPSGSANFPQMTPTSADRSSGVGSTVTFNYTGISKNEASVLMLVLTNSKTYGKASTYVNDGSVTTENASFAVTPEPGTIVMACLALPALAIRLRRKQRNTTTA